MMPTEIPNRPGNEDTGNEDTGNEDTGNEDTGNEDTGNEESGNEQSGNEDIGNDDAGNEPALQITLTVNQDGTYNVDDTAYPTIREALLAIVKIVRDNPVAENGQQQMDAGYRSESAGRGDKMGMSEEGSAAQGQ